MAFGVPNGTSLRTIRIILAAILLTWPALVAAHETSPLTDESIPADPVAPADVAPIDLLSQAGEPQRPDFLGETASKAVRRVADWAVTWHNSGGLPFAIVDKIDAKVFVFDKRGRLRGATLALLGRTRGDGSIPGIGSQELSAITIEERTTPAGRFVAALGHDLKQDVLWIDYATSVSMHRVIKGAPSDHRLRRLATASARDKRITYGCINVPVKFYQDVVLETFTGTNGIVYILPELEPIENVFSIPVGGPPDRDRTWPIENPGRPADIVSGLQTRTADGR